MSQRGMETFHLIVEQHTTEDLYQIITFKHLYTHRHQGLCTAVVGLNSRY